MRSTFGLKLSRALVCISISGAMPMIAYFCFIRTDPFMFDASDDVGGTFYFFILYWRLTPSLNFS